jgi:Ran GTPase-activating protein (RanGAP) involved in mRNA processing and transport
LQKNTRLEKVDLSDNAIGEEGALYVADMLCENDYITEIVRAGSKAKAILI